MARTETENTRAFLSRQEWLLIGGSLVTGVLAGVLTGVQANAVLIFVVSAGALALLAALVGEATDQIGARLGPGVTGVLQSALGNLPELFVGIFALRAGLVDVVQAALVGLAIIQKGTLCQEIQYHAISSPGESILSRHSARWRSWAFMPASHSHAMHWHMSSV
jgi:hypothetical protein